MLILSRKSGESLYLTLSDDIDPMTPIGEVLGEGPIVIRIGRLNIKTVKLCVDAPDGVKVLREELVGDC